MLSVETLMHKCVKLCNWRMAGKGQKARPGKSREERVKINWRDLA